MRALTERALPYSPHIEAGEADGHLFIDATGTRCLFGPPVDVAWRLRRQFRADFGLTPIWSVAVNKLVAKVATRLVKPEGEYIVRAGEEESFLAPLFLGLIPGIEREDLARLREFNFTRAGEVAALRVEELQVPFGKRARFLHETVRGVDSSPVRAVGEGPPRITADYAFGTDTNDVAVIRCAGNGGRPGAWPSSWTTRMVRAGCARRRPGRPPPMTSPCSRWPAGRCSRPGRAGCGCGTCGSSATA
jgi:DNA polymerase-4